MTPREALVTALPRSQDGDVVDAIIRDLAEQGFAILPRRATDKMVEAMQEQVIEAYHDYSWKEAWEVGVAVAEGKTFDESGNVIEK